MATRYADIIDPQVISNLIPGDWLNSIALVKSGLVRVDSGVIASTQSDFVREDVFNTEEDGQAIGVGGSISIKSKSQAKYSIPVVARADGASFDDIAEEITPDVKMSTQNNLTEAILKKSESMVDGVLVNTIMGCGLKLAALAKNYKDAGSSALSLALIQEAKAQRGDQGLFMGGFIAMKGLVYFKLGALGCVTAPTVGLAKQDQIVQMGTIGSILGMTPVMSDRIADFSDTDVPLYLLENQALILKGGVAPAVDPILRSENSFQDIVKFMLRCGATVSGMGWTASKADVVTNADLATVGNWAQAAYASKNVKMAVLRVPAVTF